jgi:hypothetical protein
MSMYDGRESARVIGNGVEFKVTSFEGDMFSIKQDRR